MQNDVYRQLKEEFNSPEFKRYLKKSKGCKCMFCGSSPVEYHHIVPLAQGGDNRINNLVPLCRACHLKAHGKNPIEGKQYKPKGRKVLDKPGNYKDVMNMYFTGVISALDAISRLGIKRNVFYKWKAEYMEENSISKFRCSKGCENNGKKRFL